MEKTKLGITRFFTGYFQNFHKLLLANVLFAVPLLIFGGGFYLLNTVTNLNLSFVYMLPIIFVFPFFSGVTVITRNIVKGEENIPVFKLFIKTVKDNFKQFLVHGFFLYFAVFFCYSSVTIYWNLAKQNGIFFFLFGIVTIISVAMLFMFYYIPAMTVTFDLSLNDIYKNAFLMSFGELKNNFFSTLGLFLLFIFCATVFFTASNATALIILTIILIVFIIPSTASYIMNFYVYKGMESIITNKSEKSAEIQDKIQQEKIKNAKKNNVEIAKEILDFSNVDLDEKKDGEEYLYFNGKMIKRRVLIDMKKKQEQENE